MAWSGRQAPRPAREHVPRYDHALDLTSALVDLGKMGDGVVDVAEMTCLLPPYHHDACYA